MRRLTPLLPVLGVCIVFTLSDRALGDEPPAKEDPAKKYAELISRLASPNKAPTRQDGPKGTKLTFPEGYDVKAQLGIKEARQVLYENIEESLPFLVAALDDDRYCMTINWANGDSYNNYSIGRVCLDVIQSWLEVYRGKLRFLGPGHWHHYDYPVSKKWWERRKGRGVAELQIEAINWAIERRVADDKERIAEGREHEIANLQKFREEIAKSGKPAPPKRMLPMVSGGR